MRSTSANRRSAASGMRVALDGMWVSEITPMRRAVSRGPHRRHIMLSASAALSADCLTMRRATRLRMTTAMTAISVMMMALTSTANYSRHMKSWSDDSMVGLRSCASASFQAELAPAARRDRRARGEGRSCAGPSPRATHAPPLLSRLWILLHALPLTFTYSWQALRRHLDHWRL